MEKMRTLQTLDIYYNTDMVEICSIVNVHGSALLKLSTSPAQNWSLMMKQRTGKKTKLIPTKFSVEAKTQQLKLFAKSYKTCCLLRLTATDLENVTYRLFFFQNFTISLMFSYGKSLPHETGIYTNKNGLNKPTLAGSTAWSMYTKIRKPNSNNISKY